MQRYFSTIKKDNLFILNSDDLHHIKTVMRMKDNDEIEVVYEKQVFLCKLNNVNDNIEINVIKELEQDNSTMPDITLIIPLLKESKMDLILQKATELGVNKIIPVITERSIVKLDEKRQTKKLERWAKICKEASEQSKRNDIPIITQITSMKNLQSLTGEKLVCSTTEKQNNIRFYLKKHKNYDRINVVIGPEGGLTNKEENLLVDMGFSRISLGSRIMRVETVPIFILSVLNYEYME